MENQMKYRIKFKDEIKEWSKEYYIKNKDYINQRTRIINECECGSFVRYDGLSQHKKSMKHRAFILQQI